MAGFSTAPAQDPALTALIQQKLVLEAKMKGGAGWFYWIAILSAVNSAVVLSGSHWHFLAGLGITDVITYIAQRAGNIGIVVAVLLNALALGVFVLFGVFALRRQTWAFIVGMTVYGLDALIFLVGGPDLFSILFHIFALFQIFKGMKAMDELEDLESQNPHLKVASAS